MSGEERRKQIIEKLGEQPVSAGKLAEAFGVSRQVIVQDVALLRAEGEPVLSTSRGYRARGRRAAIPACSRCCHTDEQGARRAAAHRRRGRQGRGTCTSGIKCTARCARRWASPPAATPTPLWKRSAAAVSAPLKKHHGRLPLPHRHGGERGRAGRHRGGGCARAAFSSRAKNSPARGARRISLYKKILRGGVHSLDSAPPPAYNGNSQQNIEDR